MIRITQAQCTRFYRHPRVSFKQNKNALYFLPVKYQAVIHGMNVEVKVTIIRAESEGLENK